MSLIMGLRLRGVLRITRRHESRFRGAWGTRHSKSVKKLTTEPQEQKVGPVLKAEKGTTVKAELEEKVDKINTEESSTEKVQKSHTMTRQPMVGMPVYCQFNIQKKVDRYRWFLGAETGSTKTLDRETTSVSDLGVLLIAAEGRTERPIRRFYEFQTTTEPVLPRFALPESAKGMLVVCIAEYGSRFGITMKESVAASELTLPGPGLCPYHERQKSIKKLKKNEFRVVSYNLLANSLAMDQFTLNGICPYCPEEFVEWKYREHLLLDEISGYKPSILCLQELDKTDFDGNFGITLGKLGYKSASSENLSTHRTAVFWRDNDFKMVSEKTFRISDCLKDKEDQLFDDIRVMTEKLRAPYLKKLDKAKDKSTKIRKLHAARIANMGHTLQLVHLEHRLTGRQVLVANTHLFWYPTANNVRVIQALICLRLIHRELEKVNRGVEIIFAGDFNSGANSAAIRLCLGEKITENDIDMYSEGLEGRFNFKEPLKSPITFKSGIEPTPDYSVFCAPFQGLLDHILYAGDCELVASLPEFKHHQVTEMTGIPSKYFPSDHLAQVALLRFGKSKK